MPLPRRAGIGLRAAHQAALLAERPPVGFVEVHSENYFGPGGRALALLRETREHYPLSLHGVGLSIGSADPLSPRHLARLAELERMLQPALISDHLCWSSIGGLHANDLLPLPATREALVHVVERLQQVQQRLGRQILVENVSSYVTIGEPEMPEWEFLAEVARRSGCGILLDVNNVYVSACNHGFDPLAYLQAMPAPAVREIHLAGHLRRDDGAGGEILLDTHSRPVCDAVWALYGAALDRFGPVPTLIEWDADLPPLAVLVAESARAERMMEARDACAA